MADDTYTRSFSFAGFQSNRPNLPLPGQRVDIELDNIARVLGLLQKPGSLPGGGPLAPIPPGTLLANLTSSTAIPTAVSVGALKGSLGLGTAASLNVGEPGGVAAYNDPRFGGNADVSGFLTKAGNLAGLADLPAARTNLGLGAAATRAVGISGGLALYDDPRFGQGGDLSAYLTKAGNLSGLVDIAAARQNLGLGAAATRAFGITGGVASYDDPRFAQVGGNTYGYVDPMVDYGAKGDGVTDDSAAWQAAVDSRRPIRPSKPPVAYLINTGVLIRGNTYIEGFGHGNNKQCILRTTTNVDTFRFNNNIAGVVIKGLAFEHTGPASGCCINMNNGQGCIIESNSFSATGNITATFWGITYTTVSDNVSDIVFCGGGLNWFSFNYFDNFRRPGDGFCIAFDKRLSQANHCIENHVEENYCGGVGPFVYSGSREGRDPAKYNQAVQTKPEGIHIKNNSVQTFAPSLVIESGLLFHIIGNSFCIANGTTVILRPIGPGILDLRSRDNWYDSTGNMTGGPIVAFDDTYWHETLRPAAVMKTAHFSDWFYYGKFGVTLSGNATDVDFTGSHFENIEQVAISAPGCKGLTIGSTFAFCGRAFTLIDSPNGQGGPFILGNCQFAPANMAFDLVLTNPDNFRASYETFGMRFARKFTRITNTNTITAATSSGHWTRFLNVPHGLATTPNPDKCFATVQYISGGANFEGAFAMVVSVDATNVVLKIYIAGLAQPGDFKVNCDFSV